VALASALGYGLANADGHYNLTNSWARFSRAQAGQNRRNTCLPVTASLWEVT
jgi:hypothetical protein